MGVLATPRGAIHRDTLRQDLAAVEAIVAETESERVIVGCPIGLSGAPTAETRRAERFGKFLADELAVPVELWDERMTTAMAGAVTGSDSKTREAGRRDAVAAAFILQGYLDHRGRS